MQGTGSTGSGGGRIRERVKRHATALAAAALTGSACAGTSCGYAVVDPMPSPSCPSLAGKLVVTAQWVDDLAGGTVLEVKIARPADRSDVTFGQPSAATTGVTLLTPANDGQSISFRLRVPGTPPRVDVSFTASCSGGTDSMDLALTIGSTHAVGEAVTFTVSDNSG